MSKTHPRPKDDPKAKQPKRTSAPTEDNDMDDEGGNRFLLFNVMPSWMVSFLTHVAVIIILAILVMPSREERIVALEAGEQVAAELDSIDLNLDALEFEDTSELLESEISEEEPTEVTEMTEVSLPEAEVELGNIMGMEDAMMDTDLMGELSDSALTEETSSRTGDYKKTDAQRLRWQLSLRRISCVGTKVDRRPSTARWKLEL